MKAIARCNTATLSLVVSVVIVFLAGSSWRPKAAQKTEGPKTPTQNLKSPRRIGPVAVGDRGETYHWLESRATRVTTTFADAIAIAERGADGRLSARLTDVAGNELATFKVNQMGGRANDDVEFTAAGGSPIKTARRATLKPTLDWSNQQTYTLWKDRRTATRSDPSGLKWEGTFIRRADAEPRDVERATLKVQTDWDSGFSAVAVRRRASRKNVLTGQPAQGDVISSRINRDGVEVGHAEWYAEEQVFAWSFPGLTEGYLSPSHLKIVGGAWPFVPDMAWLNMQNLAFHHFHSLLKSQGSVARRANPNLFNRIVEWWVPRVLANEPGCDGLHWFDNTTLRPCCDTHDRCYAAYGCNYTSWWTWWSSWTCDLCNMWVVTCFGAGGPRGPLHPSPF